MPHLRQRGDDIVALINRMRSCDCPIVMRYCRYCLVVMRCRPIVVIATKIALVKEKRIS